MPQKSAILVVVNRPRGAVDGAIGHPLVGLWWFGRGRSENLERRAVERKACCQSPMLCQLDWVKNRKDKNDYVAVAPGQRFRRRTSTRHPRASALCTRREHGKRCRRRILYSFICTRWPPCSVHHSCSSDLPQAQASLPSCPKFTKLRIRGSTATTATYPVGTRPHSFLL
jgi:hypothetical protein